MKYLVWIFECLFAPVKYFSVRTCHSCAQCSRPLEIGQACDGADGEIYCTPCYARSVSNKGPATDKHFGDPFINTLVCTSQIYFYMPRLDYTRPNRKPPWRLCLSSHVRLDSLLQEVWSARLRLRWCGKSACSDRGGQGGADGVSLHCLLLISSAKQWNYSKQ